MWKILSDYLYLDLLILVYIFSLSFRLSCELQFVSKLSMAIQTIPDHMKLWFTIFVELNFC